DRTVTGVQTCALPIFGRVERQAISARERELRLQAPVAPELRPAFTPGVLLRRRTDEIVARPAEALRLPAVHGSEHGAERREVARSEERRVGKEWRAGG